MSSLTDEARGPAAITIRPAGPDDADGIARVFLESAEYHARLDADRYSVPDGEAISTRYRDGRQHPDVARGEAETLVAERGGEIVGFVDARLDRSPDPMHRELIYCQVVEIAVSERHRNGGVGRRLLRAAEDWGRRRGADLVSLEYLAVNVGASGFYQHCGYRPASITAIKRL